MSARQSKVAKARAALTSRLATLDAEGQRLRNAHNLLEQATRREAELIEARANELVEDLRDNLAKAQEEITHLRNVRGEALGKWQEARDALEFSRGLTQKQIDKNRQQAATLHRLGTEVVYHENNARVWRNVASVLGALAIVFGALLGNQLI